MKFYLIAAVLGCALISSGVCNVVPATEHSLVQLEEVPQNVDQQAPIVAEPLNEATSPQLQKILLQIPELIQGAADDGQMKSDETADVANNNPDAVVALPQDGALQSNREARQLIGFIPTYMLRQAMLQDDEVYDASDEIEEERAIRRRKRFRKRNTRGHVRKTRRHKNINKRNHKKHRKVNTKRRSPNRYSSLRKRKVPRTKNKKTKNKNKNKNQTRPKGNY